MDQSQLHTFHNYSKTEVISYTWRSALRMGVMSVIIQMNSANLFVPYLGLSRSYFDHS